MKLSKLYTWLLFPFSLTAQVFSNTRTIPEDFCPNLDSINRINENYYKAGSWDGIIQGTNQNGEVKNFKEVVYSAENQTDPFVNGKLLHCSYELNNRKELDMRLPKDKNRARINTSSDWHNIQFFGEPSPQYFCEKSIEHCQFNLMGY